MEVKFTGQCMDVIRRLELDRALVERTCNNRTRGMLVPGNPPQVYATTWHDNGPILYVNGIISRAQQEGEQLKIQDVTLALALELKEELPGGVIEPAMTMDNILAVVANSFGLLISVDPNAPPTRLYNGSWQGDDFSPSIQFAEKMPDDECLVTGVFNHDRMCHHVWAFSYKKYSSWFVGGTGEKMKIVISQAARETCLDVFYISASHVRNAILEKDQVEVIALEGLRLLCFSKEIVASPSKRFFLLVCAQEKGKNLYVQQAFKINKRLCESEEELHPLKLLELLARTYGYDISVGDRTDKFILYERIPVASNRQDEVLKVHHPPGDQVMYILNFRIVRDDDTFHADCAMCFALNIEAYKKDL